MIVPACTTKGDAGRESLSGAVVRRSTGALTNSSLRSWPFCAKVSSEDDAVLVAVSWDGACGGATGAVVGANTLLVRAASVSWLARCCSASSPIGADWLSAVDDRTPQVSWQWRPKPGNVARNAGIVLRQRRQAICDIVMIRAVEFVRRRIARMVAPERPQHRARDEQQSQRGAAGKHLAGKPRDPRTLCTQTQGLRGIIR